MLFSMPSYEVKYHDKNDWERISETNVLGKLQDAFDQVTPVIQELIEGKQVPTATAVFRIKAFDGVPFD